MNPGDVVRLKSGTGPVMVVEGPVVGGKGLVCIYFVNYSCYREEILEACLELCEPE